MLIIRGPIKPYIFWIKIILAIFLAKTRPDKTIFSALTNLTIDFDAESAQITLSCSIILRARNMCCLFHIFPKTLTFQVKKDELTAPSGKSAVKLPEVLSPISILSLVFSHTYVCFCCEEWWKKTKRNSICWIRANGAKDKVDLALGVISVIKRTE